MNWQQSLAAVGAILAGVSVTLQLGGTISLNGPESNDQLTQMLHSLYVTQGGILVGAVWLGVAALVVPGDAPKRPQCWWSLFGGVVTIPAFVTTPAAQVLGLQVVLMLLLLGMVGAALFFDWQAHQLCLGKIRLLGLTTLLLGVILELADAVPEVNGSLQEVALYLTSCLVTGVLFAVQSKMNLRLALDLGSSMRSATWSNLSCFVVGGLMLLVVRFGFRVSYTFLASQWWIWVLVGLQSAFYTLSLALLPKVLGYTSLFVLVLAGKLGSSAAADMLGLFQAAEPLSALRCVSVFVILLGAVLYSLLGSSEAATVQPSPPLCGEQLSDDEHGQVEAAKC